MWIFYCRKLTLRLKFECKCNSVLVGSLWHSASTRKRVHHATGEKTIKNKNPLIFVSDFPTVE